MKYHKLWQQTRNQPIIERASAESPLLLEINKSLSDYVWDNFNANTPLNQIFGGKLRVVSDLGASLLPSDFVKLSKWIQAHTGFRLSDENPGFVTKSISREINGVERTSTKQIKVGKYLQKLNKVTTTFEQLFNQLAQLVEQTYVYKTIYTEILKRAKSIQGQTSLSVWARRPNTERFSKYLARRVIIDSKMCGVGPSPDVRNWAPNFSIVRDNLMKASVPVTIGKIKREIERVTQWALMARLPGARPAEISSLYGKSSWLPDMVNIAQTNIVSGLLEENPVKNQAWKLLEQIYKHTQQSKSVGIDAHNLIYHIVQQTSLQEPKSLDTNITLLMSREDINSPTAAQLTNFIDQWPQIKNQMNNRGLKLVISRHPIDLVRMADFKHIESCHSQGGGYFQCAVAEAQGLGVVAYAIRADDFEKVKDIIETEEEIFNDKQRKIISGIEPTFRLRARLFEFDFTQLEFAFPRASEAQVETLEDLEKKNIQGHLVVPEIEAYGIEGHNPMVPKASQEFTKFLQLAQIPAMKAFKFGLDELAYAELHLEELGQIVSLHGGDYEDTEAFALIEDFFGSKPNAMRLIGDVPKGDAVTVTTQPDVERFNPWYDFNSIVLEKVKQSINVSSIIELQDIRTSNPAASELQFYYRTSLRDYEFYPPDQFERKIYNTYLTALERLNKKLTKQYEKVLDKLLPKSRIDIHSYVSQPRRTDFGYELSFTSAFDANDNRSAEFDRDFTDEETELVVNFISQSVLSYHTAMLELLEKLTARYKSYKKYAEYFK